MKCQNREHDEYSARRCIGSIPKGKEALFGGKIVCVNCYEYLRIKRKRKRNRENETRNKEK